MKKKYLKELGGPRPTQAPPGYAPAPHKLIIYHITERKKINIFFPLNKMGGPRPTQAPPGYAPAPPKLIHTHTHTHTHRGL